MIEIERGRVRNRIGTRLALVVAGIVFVSMMLAYNAERFVAERYTAHFVVSHDGQPLEGSPAFDELGRRILSQAEWERMMARTERSLGIALALLGTLFALGVGWIVSRIVTQRVRSLAHAVQAPIAEDQTLPGPFDVGRMDEIGVLVAALNDMRQRVQSLVGEIAERDRQRRDWVALVSHDLRNPLQALTACIDRAVEEARRMPEAPRRTTMHLLLQTARFDVERFEVMTLDLLDLARLDADDSLVLEPVPPGEIARGAAAGMRVLAESQGRRLEVHVAPRCPELLADGRRLLRALENLMRNAIQHAQRRIVVRVERAASDGSFAREALRFSVDDDGPGLPTQLDGAVDVARLGAYKSRDDSAGLGLVVARRVAEAHGGRIGAHNRTSDGPDGPRHEGGTVWFEIPLGQIRPRHGGTALAAAELDGLEDEED